MGWGIEGLRRKRELIDMDGSVVIVRGRGLGGGGKGINGDEKNKII